MSDTILESLWTCPQCGFARQETMPTDACQFYYECSNCKVLLRPNSESCCAQIQETAACSVCSVR
jgi:hypothetical protein